MRSASGRVDFCVWLEQATRWLSLVSRRWRQHRWRLAMVRWCVAVCLLWPIRTQASDVIDFDRDVRPILSDKCVYCHGPDEETRAADLRLDSPAGWTADLGGYQAVVPGKLDESELWRRISAEDPTVRMPPPEAKLGLTDAQRQVLRRWIEQGAPWSPHWAFVAPERPLPPLDASGWSRGPVDTFLRNAAQRQGLQPNPEASREKLLRRLTLDLTGLPPQPAELDAFLRDESPDAYEKVVDRLLASPAYGQRMAWEWLEAGRYADTDGFQGDPTRSMWPWKDWLVDALNDNLPFDEFTVTLLAGDLLPQPTPEQIVATAFNRNHMFNGEGGRIPEETRVENVFDRTETVATVWLGLTFTCCRCHDHKFDPFTQEEYYRFFAFFNNTSEDGRSGRGKTPPVYDYLSPQLRRRQATVRAELDRVTQAMESDIPELDSHQQSWEDEMRQQLDARRTPSAWGTWYRTDVIPVPAERVFAEPLGPEKTLPGPIDPQAAASDGSRWVAAPDLPDGVVHSLPDTVGATYFLREVFCAVPRSFHLSLGSDDGIKVWIDGQLVVAKDTRRAAAADQEQVTIDLPAGRHQLLVKIANAGGIGGFYFRVLGELPYGLTADIAEALRTPDAQRTSSQRRLLRQHYRRQHWEQWDAWERRRQQLQEQLDGIAKQAVRVMVMDDLPERRPTFVLHRGDYQKPLQEVHAGTPAVLPPLPDGPEPARLRLAKWLISPHNPLTARVIVNRHWQMFFGRGLVETAEDFGSQGQRPSHPELLDWLATRLIESGWDIKQLHRDIVLSSAYRQSASVPAEAGELDPENRWWMRGPRYRLPSWMLRDQALAAAGLLSSRFGGPPVKPYQPDGLWAEATFGKIRYQRDTGEALYRRSLYVFWRRIVGPPMFFDAAKRQTCEVRPTRTNTPLQALTEMNETAMVECARAMAQRCLIEGGKTDEERLRYAFRLVTSRWPRREETEILRRRLEDSRRRFQQQPEEARQLLAVGESSRVELGDPIDHAALTVVCNLLLNLDEVLTRE